MLQVVAGTPTIINVDCFPGGWRIVLVVARIYRGGCASCGVCGSGRTAPIHKQTYSPVVAYIPAGASEQLEKGSMQSKSSHS